MGRLSTRLELNKHRVARWCGINGFWCTETVSKVKNYILHKPKRKFFNACKLIDRAANTCVDIIKQQVILISAFNTKVSNQQDRDVILI